VSKHAQATRATISIRVLANFLIVEVQDNGVGFQPELVARVAMKSPRDNGPLHLGLRTMRERIREAGGSLEIESDSERGTCVRARFTLVSSAQLLTDREHEVLRLIVAGQTNRDIAEKLSIGLETVKSHVHHIMQKMQVKDRTQAAVLATRHGWL
jgi:DNA-binding NarL/FixJ family response regulator